MERVYLLKQSIANVYRHARNDDFKRATKEMETFLTLGKESPFAAIMQRFDAFENSKKYLEKEFDEGHLEHLTQTYRLMCKIYDEVLHTEKVNKLFEELSEKIDEFYPRSLKKRRKILNRLERKAERS